ncbi:MAG: hypothetical protein IAF58_15035, partial [Leptolyngbya sp.]|nr:hypothetical protein [Candidatus Melainabacteria bacterium]
NAIVAEGQIFHSADGHERISFSKANASVEHAGVSVNKPYLLLSNRWRELFFVLWNGSSEPWTLKGEKNLVTESGVTLLPASDSTTKLVPVMKRLADDLYSKINSTSLKDLRSITLNHYTNPFTGLYAVPSITVLSSDMKDATAGGGQEKVRSMIDHAAKYSDIDRRALPWQKRPGAILCLLSSASSQPTNIQFYILGIDANHQLISCCRSGKPLYFHGGLGIGPSMNCEGSEPSTEKRLIIARRTKQSLAEIRNLVLWDLVLLIPFIACTVALQTQFSAKQLSERAFRSKIAMLQLAVWIYIPFALAYILFTLFVFARVSE